MQTATNNSDLKQKLLVEASSRTAGKPDVVLIRYFDFSIIKSGTKTEPGNEATRRHVLTINSPLSPQNVVLNITANKELRLNDVLVQQWCNIEMGLFPCSSSLHNILCHSICQHSILKTWKGQWLILINKLVHICAMVSISIISLCYQINTWFEYCSITCLDQLFGHEVNFPNWIKYDIMLTMLLF